jgi:hypothetical protein
VLATIGQEVRDLSGVRATLADLHASQVVLLAAIERVEVMVIEIEGRHGLVDEDRTKGKHVARLRAKVVGGGDLSLWETVVAYWRDWRKEMNTAISLLSVKAFLRTKWKVLFVLGMIIAALCDTVLFVFFAFIEGIHRFTGAVDSVHDLLDRFPVALIGPRRDTGINRVGPVAVPAVVPAEEQGQANVGWGSWVGGMFRTRAGAVIPEA